MGRFATSWDLAKASGRVLRSHGTLSGLAVICFLASGLTVALVAGIGQETGVFPRFLDPETGDVRPLALALGVLVYLLLACVNVYFAAAVVAGANTAMSGATPTLGSSLAAAGRRTGRLLAWAFVTATVSVLLRIVQERGSVVGRIVAALGSMAWHLATFFVIPVLLFEDAPLRQTLGRSGQLFKRTWGETVLSAGIGLVFAVAAGGLALGAILLAGSIDLRSATGGIVLLVILCAAAVLANLYWVFQGVYKAALYRYATTGQVPVGFTPGQVQAAFSPVSPPGP